MFLALIFSMNLVSAQEVGVNVNKIEAGDQDTTISIHKGKANEVKSGSALYEIIENKEQVAGDAAPLLKDARAKWKVACNDWKKETRENNKDNKILILNCGVMNCSTEKMESVCTSEGQVKMKVKVTE